MQTQPEQHLALVGSVAASLDAAAVERLALAAGYTIPVSAPAREGVSLEVP